MQNNHTKIKNLKLLILQSKYKSISSLILNLNDQIIFLESNFYPIIKIPKKCKEINEIITFFTE
jgi:hypothetical protein